MAAELRAKLGRLAPYCIGDRGQLRELAQDYRETEPPHRHVSHLYGPYLGNQITAETTPELFAAAARRLELRAEEATVASTCFV